MKKIKSAAVSAFVFCLFTVLSAVPECVYGQTGGGWSITHSLNVSECSPGDTVTLSVFLKKGSGADSMTVSSMDGELEYDSSLFEISDADLTPVGSPSSVGFREGSISIRYSSGVKVADGGLLFSIRLHVKDSGSSGRTTVCVTDLRLGDSAGIQTISNFVPSAVTITGSDTLEEDEDWEDEAEDWDDETEDEIEDNGEQEEEPQDTKASKDSKKKSSVKKTSTASASSNTAQKTSKNTKTTKKTPFQTGDGSQDSRSLAAGGILMLMGIIMLFARGRIR